MAASRQSWACAAPFVALALLGPPAQATLITTAKRCAYVRASLAGTDYPEDSPLRISRFYPDRAQRMEVEGEVTVRCTRVGAQYPQCAVTMETPTNFGFGDGAIRVAAILATRKHGDLDAEVHVHFILGPAAYTCPARLTPP